MGETKVTREQARKLLGGYATGSLTEAERKLLFDAALDDQELFDELADEQALKELIDSPGARQRLIAAVQPAKTNRLWWILGAAAAAASVSIAVWLVSPRQEQLPSSAPAEIAEVRPAPAPAPSPIPPFEPEVPRDRPKQPAASQTRELPDAVPERKESVEAPAVEAFSQPAAPPPAVPAPSAKPVAAAEDSALLKTEAQLAQPARATANAFSALPAGGRTLAAGQQGATAGPLRYEFLPSGVLRITPVAAGTLEVRSGQQILFTKNPVAARIGIDVPVPADIQEVRLEFTPPNQAPMIVTAPVPR